jgi:hypothetical protein
LDSMEKQPPPVALNCSNLIQPLPDGWTVDSFKRPSLEEDILLPRRNRSHDVDKADTKYPT